MVSKISGCDPKVYEEVCKTFAATGAPDKPVRSSTRWYHAAHVRRAEREGVFHLAASPRQHGYRGWRHINAVRGESNVQGSTDFSMLFGNWPGYNPAPTASLKTLKDYFEKNVPKTAEPKSLNWQGNRPKWIVSYLKAMYGDHATKENDWAYELLPKLDEGKNYSILALFETMYKGTVEGLFLWGMNPVVGSPNSRTGEKCAGQVEVDGGHRPLETETSTSGRHRR